MNLLGVSFSGRAGGNCAACLDYCLGYARGKGHQAESLSMRDLKVRPCGDCDYACFGKRGCPIDDDAARVYAKWMAADQVIMAVPTHCGHLASSYFVLSERGQSILPFGPETDSRYLRKVNFIVVGNTSASGDMALHEALYTFANRPYYPEAILLSSREYGRKSIAGNLMQEPEVQDRLRRFVERVLSRA